MRILESANITNFVVSFDDSEIKMDYASPSPTVIDSIRIWMVLVDFQSSPH